MGCGSRCTQPQPVVSSCVTPHQVLAVIRLRQWQYERVCLRSGRTVHLRVGRPARARRSTDADAAMVRCIDFERALGTLRASEQAALLAIYHDGATRKELANALASSERSIYALVDTALTHLADTLDRLDLL